jgi:hypothetical protein
MWLSSWCTVLGSNTLFLVLVKTLPGLAPARDVPCEACCRHKNDHFELEGFLEKENLRYQLGHFVISVFGIVRDIGLVAGADRIHQQSEFRKFRHFFD